MLDEVSALAFSEEKGVQKGLEQGAKQRDIEIARTAIENGFDNETISKLTRLSLSEIETIRKENKK